MDAYLILAACAVPLIAIAVAAWAAVATYRAREAWTKALLACVAMLAALACPAWLHQVSRWREYALSEVTSANLRLIGKAVLQYSGEHHAAPDRLPAFNESCLIAVNDPAFHDGWTPEYTSFVYRPADAGEMRRAERVLIHEREPWSLLDAGWFAQRGHQALFGDLRVERLTPAELQKRLAEAP